MAGRTVVRSDGGPRDGSYRNFELRGCAVTTSCRWRASCLPPRPVAEPGTLLLGARLSGDPTQRSVARLAPSNCLESLLAAPRLFLSSLVTWSFRTTDEPLPFCRASAPEAFSQWRGRTGRRRIGDSTWKSADRRVSRWIGGLCRSTGGPWVEAIQVKGSRTRARLREGGEVGPQQYARGRQPQSSFRFWRSCAGSGLASQRWSSKQWRSHPPYADQRSWVPLQTTRPV